MNSIRGRCYGGDPVPDTTRSRAGRKETTMNNTTQFYNVDDVSRMLGISKSFSYRLIRQMSEKLKSEGYITISGKISKKYFDERIYGGINNAGI